MHLFSCKNIVKTILFKKHLKHAFVYINLGTFTHFCNNPSFYRVFITQNDLTLNVTHLRQSLEEKNVQSLARSSIFQGKWLKSIEEQQ